MHFDLVDLRLFVGVSDELSLTRGAAKVALSTPAASLRIKNLELSVGTPLFDRSSQGLRLRPAGHALLHHARLVLRQVAILRGDLGEYAQGVKGHLRVLVNTSAMSDHFTEALRTFLIEHPEVNIDVREKLSPDIVRAVNDASADLGIISERVKSDGLAVFPYRRDRLVLVTPAQHPLAARASVAFEDTLDYDFVGLQEGSAIHTVLEQAARDAHRRLLIRAQIASYEMICRMIEKGLGIGILPESAARQHAVGNGIRMLALEDGWSRNDLVICARDLTTLPSFARELIDLLMAETPGQPRRQPVVAYS